MDKHFHRDEFGICPICGEPLFLFTTNRQMFQLNTGGSVTNECVSTESIRYVCLLCKFTSNAKKTIEGVRPVDYASRLNNISIDKENPIGRVIND